MGARTAAVAGSVGLVFLSAAVLVWQRVGAAGDGWAAQSVAIPLTVSELNGHLAAGTRRLSAEGPSGYLRSLLEALDIPIESQMLVLSETSLQSEHISPKNPRALYFNDQVAVGWVRGAETIEVAALDPAEGMVFYTLPQKSDGAPQFVREDARCLQCHRTPFTGGAPGMLVMSMLPLSDDPLEYAQGWPVDHRTPIVDRWGGWYVTGERVPRVHLGNVPVHHAERSYVRMPVAPILRDASGQFDASGYLSPHSDVVAQLVFNHQVEMANRIARLSSEARAAAAEGRAMDAGIEPAVNELVDYLLFMDEELLPAAVRGASGFAEMFASMGPRDRRGRSLRQLDLEGRLFRYPCSYMIYTPAFDAMPEAARDAVYRRLWEILSGRDDRYSSLAPEDRQAVLEILRDTKKGLPDYFLGAG